MKRTLFLSSALIMPVAAMAADVPYRFSADQDAVADHVNANFTHLDNRIDFLESALNDLALGDAPIENSHGINPYTPLQAEIGDVVDTIQGVDFVLGAVPFRDFGSDAVYKLVLPMARYACERTETDAISYGDEQFELINNYSCANGGEYYYQFGVEFGHYTHGSDKFDLTISGYPAHIEPYTKETSEYRILPRADDEMSDDPWVINNTVHTNWYTNTEGFHPALHIQSGETRIIVKYQDERFGRITDGASAPLESSDGPDFTLSPKYLDMVNNHVDTDVMNQYVGLYNYVSIQPLN